jgi:hypothetical protein
MKDIPTMQERFTRNLLRRHRGETEAALEEVRGLRLASEFGQEFYCKVEHGLYVRLAMEKESWRR